LLGLTDNECDLKVCDHDSFYHMSEKSKMLSSQTTDELFSEHSSESADFQ